MPYKSKAQQAKFHAMESRGEISHETVAEWEAIGRIIWRWCEGFRIELLDHSRNPITIATEMLIAGRIPNMTPDAKPTPHGPVAPEYRSREAHRGRLTDRHYRAPQRDWTGWMNGAGTLRALRVSPMSTSRRSRRTGRRWDFLCLLCGGEASYWPRWVEQGRRMSCGCLRRGLSSRPAAPGVLPRLSEGSAQGCQAPSESHPNDGGEP